MKKTQIDDRLEKVLLQTGYKYVIGVDEVGRGSWAGPVVVCAYLYKNTSEVLPQVNDSKLLTVRQREHLFLSLQKDEFSLGKSEAEEIDSRNIVEATKDAIKKAVQTFDLKDSIVLIDGTFNENFDFNHRFIIKGDSKHYSIAAASVLAKVTRDRLMREYAIIYPEYGFDTNVGYGTKKHREGLARYGITSIHRKSYAPVRKAFDPEKYLKDL